MSIFTEIECREQGHLNVGWDKTGLDDEGAVEGRVDFSGDE